MTGSGSAPHPFLQVTIMTNALSRVNSGQTDEPSSNAVDNGNGYRTMEDMCIRCREASASQPLDYCATCSLEAQHEVSVGLRMLEQYLAAWAAFDTWLDGHGRQARGR